VAPREVKSSDIYWGAVPWVLLQMVMVALVIAFPVMVTGLLDAPSKIDASKVKIELAPTYMPDEDQPIVIGPGKP
ncbi:MAG: C4-dicarboxylate ABC transporter, partial [Rhodospirillales bacterium]|nr:C4-dicarboxylate ABC transporter [Rhodospirillales bacterium]